MYSAGTSINVEYVAFVNEQRYFNNIAGVHGCGFAAAGSRIAADARVGFNNSQFNGIRQINADNAAVVIMILASMFSLRKLMALPSCSLVSSDCS